MASHIEAPVGPVSAVELLRDAINTHDLDALVACFHPEVRSAQPMHPARSFQGSQNIRQNWSMIFGGVPDLRAELLRTASSGKIDWAEWRWSGTSRDGKAFVKVGVTILEVDERLITDVSMYMEPVEVNGATNAIAIQEAIGAPR